MSVLLLLVLGFLSGATILLGLPVARLKAFSSTARSALTMLATGILIFLLIDIMGNAMSQAAGPLAKNVPEGSIEAVAPLG